MKPWIILSIAVFTEICWALSLKYIQNHPTALNITISVLLSFVNMALLSFAMRDIPPGTAYAIWTGLGSVGVTIGSILLYGDPTSALRIFFLCVIIFGVVGLKLVT